MQRLSVGRAALRAAAVTFCASIFPALLVVLVLAPAPAQAQATRTWVSGVGDDANPCSRTAPCKTFPGAISKTAAGGEINCLDSGGFGALTITKSITIICDQVEGGVLVSGTNGINVNAGPNDIVFLSGLDIFGVNTGLVGINFIAGAALRVHNCTIRGFRAGNGVGIQMTTGTNAKLDVIKTRIADNGSGTNGAGIVVSPSAAVEARVTLTDVAIYNSVVGIKVDLSTAATVMMSVRDSAAVGNDFNGIAALAGSGTINMMVTDSLIANNGTNGINATGTNSIVRIADSAITGNTTAGIKTGTGGQVLSYGNNQIDGNGTDLPAPPVIPQR